MTRQTIAGTALGLILACTTSARADLRHVEIKTLGMD